MVYKWLASVVSALTTEAEGKHLSVCEPELHHVPTLLWPGLCHSSHSRQKKCVFFVCFFLFQEIAQAKPHNKQFEDGGAGSECAQPLLSQHAGPNTLEMTPGCVWLSADFHLNRMRACGI